MEGYTYQATDIKNQLEEYEWDHTWFERTDKTDGKRILYIGDSISGATRCLVTKLSFERYHTDGIATSKALDNPYFKPMISMFAKQEVYRDAVLFNNGLHGWQIDDAEYGRLYGEFLDFLKAEFPDTPIFALLTTDITEAYSAERVGRTKVRNEFARKEAEKRGIKIIDLYSITKGKNELHTKEGIHFLPEGYEMIAKKIIEDLDANL